MRRYRNGLGPLGVKCCGLGRMSLTVFSISQASAPIERAAGKRISVPPVQLKSSLLRAAGPGATDTQQQQQMRRWPEHEEGSVRQFEEHVGTYPPAADGEADKEPVMTASSSAAGEAEGEGEGTGAGGEARASDSPQGVFSCGEAQDLEGRWNTGAGDQQEGSVHFVEGGQDEEEQAAIQDTGEQ